MTLPHIVYLSVSLAPGPVKGVFRLYLSIKNNVYNEDNLLHWSKVSRGKKTIYISILKGSKSRHMSDIY